MFPTCSRWHSYAALKGRHLPAHHFCETRLAPFGSRERLVQDMPWLEKCSVAASNAHAAICEGSSGVYEVSRNGRTANVIATKDYTYMWPGFFGGEVAAMRYLFQN